MLINKISAFNQSQALTVVEFSEIQDSFYIVFSRRLVL